KKGWEGLLGQRLTVIETVAGSKSGYGGDDGPAREAKLLAPNGLARGTDGTIYVADSANGRIRAISPAGKIRTVAGGGTAAASSSLTASADLLGDGGPATGAVLQEPRGVLPITFGFLSGIAITEFAGMRLRVVLPDGTLKTLIQGKFSQGTEDGPIATLKTRVSIHFPSALLKAPDGAIVLVDTGNNVLRRITIPNPLDPESAVIERLAGNYQRRNNLVQVADGTRATQAPLANPVGACFASDGTLFITELSGHHVVKVSPDGKLYNVAGSGGDVLNGDGGQALQAGMPYPSAVACDDARGRILVGNWQAPRIRAVDLKTGVISTIAGGGEQTEDGLAESSSLTDIGGMVLEPDGNLLFTDSQSGRVRRLWLADPPGN
ncbi:MAG: hypothetical protein FJZ00_10455, partial [Candidatus Sericytochromatia bacterium]|nr:hypothetical protein [Candidatus Tanganyikabacteria bacterium]